MTSFPSWGVFEARISLGRFFKTLTAVLKCAVSGEAHTTWSPACRSCSVLDICCNVNYPPVNISSMTLFRLFQCLHLLSAGSITNFSHKRTEALLEWLAQIYTVYDCRLCGVYFLQPSFLFMTAKLLWAPANLHWYGKRTKVLHKLIHVHGHGLCGSVF